MPGWTSDYDDDPDPRTAREAKNAARQARRLAELVAAAVEAPRDLSLSPMTICDFNRLAVDGLVAHPGEYRQDDQPITGSRHVPPPWREVPGLVDSMCAHVNLGGHEAVEIAAYTLWRINWIHPFEDGNGRAARAAAYLVLCACLGQDLPGEVTLIERLAWQKIRYWRCHEAADEAALAGRVDVTALAELLREVIEAQLQGALT